MLCASVSTVFINHVGFSSSETGWPSHSGAFSASTSVSAMGSPKFTTTWPKFCLSTLGMPHSSAQIDSFSFGRPVSSSR
ncbi:hypothetical protein D3C81_2127600 [compost metagenome]